jgi:hypothetical protein
VTIQEKISRLKAIRIDQLFDQMLKDKEKDILDMNRDQMYEDGVMDVNVPNFQQEYAASTKVAKRRAAYPKTDFVTLKWTGDFHSQLKLYIFKEYFVINSLNEIWGKYLSKNQRFINALGLTEDNKSRLRDMTQQEIVKRIRDVI